MTGEEMSTTEIRKEIDQGQEAKLRHRRPGRDDISNVHAQISAFTRVRGWIVCSDSADDI